MGVNGLEQPHALIVALLTMVNSPDWKAQHDAVLKALDRSTKSLNQHANKGMLSMPSRIFAEGYETALRDLRSYIIEELDKVDAKKVSKKIKGAS